MSKLILLLSLLGTVIVFAFGLTDPSSPVMWLASTSISSAWLRLVIMLALAALLATHPPRNIYLRFIIGLLAASLAGWALWSTYENQMKFLDTLVVLQFSVCAGLTVLESKYLMALPSEEERLAAAREARHVARLVLSA